jgi:MoxR-like ATPase
MPTSPCEQCEQRIEFPEEMAGQEIDCPTCGKRTVLREPGAPVVRIPRNKFKLGGGFGGPGTAARAGLAAQEFEVRDRAETEVATLAQKIIDNVEKVIVGKRPEITLALTACLAEGHLLLEDVPGVAKTMLARSIAQSIGCVFKRIQCTPDLLPNDITGASVFNPKNAEFEFRPGPVFAQVLLADEINRTTPRTQSALLEAMSERQVTVDGRIYLLQRPFFLVATQNPVDHEGTFPLPEAQLDRFLMRLSLGYPGMDEEGMMLERFQLARPLENLEPVAGAEEIVKAQEAVRAIHMDRKVRDYILQIVRGTREHHAIILGGSPRASLGLFRAAQASAAIQGFGYVLPDDVKQIAPAVLTHRLMVRPESRLKKMTPASVVAEILNSVEAPALAANLEMR